MDTKSIFSLALYAAFLIFMFLLVKGSFDFLRQIEMNTYRLVQIMEQQQK